MRLSKSVYAYSLITFLSVAFLTSYAFADSSVVAPQDFFAQVLQAIHGFGGLPTVLKIASIIALIVASMKVTVLNELLWSKLGAFKVWVAPVLGLLAGILNLAGSPGGVTVASVFAYISAGAGAVVLHELLDSIKAIPGLGPIYVGIVDLIEKSLGGPSSKV